MLKIGFHILAIISAIAIVLEKDYLKMIISFSLFSLFATVIYFLNYAPDVAIAEIAIGSAILPIMLLISVSKQRQFIIAGDVGNQCFLNDGDCQNVLGEFCNFYDLDLRYADDITENQYILAGVFRKINVDLYVKKREGIGGYFFIGKEASALMHKLDQMTRENPQITVILAPDIDSLGGDVS